MTFEKEVERSRDPAPAVLHQQVLEQITPVELNRMIQEFTFENFNCDLNHDHTLLQVTFNGCKIIFFAEENWNTQNPAAWFGMMLTLPGRLSVDSITSFNQRTRIGRAVNMSGTNYSVLRHDVQLAGGVTRKNIYLQIKAFFNSAKSLVLETAEATGNAH